ncbi:uncharacterized protein LOC129749799 [Uranotaenia lowii]|uniref:uncharacterized protein LOC129749799 n=1 Tax=Uranotaenia lowii TaxID=190385 RepID=UPI00247AE171|nr:uncharacterized protein LOC129749799 [Uranotaenia lowii]
MKSGLLSVKRPGSRLKLVLLLVVFLESLTGRTEAAELEPTQLSQFPAVVIRRASGSPKVSTGGEFCAAYRVSDGGFLTSSQCYDGKSPLNIQGMGHVRVDRVWLQPKINRTARQGLTLFRFTEKSSTPGVDRKLSITSKATFAGDRSCEVVKLNKHFQWSPVTGASLADCSKNNPEADRICYRLTTGDESALDFAVLCRGYRVLQAILHSRSGKDLQFVDCNRAGCLNFVKHKFLRRMRKEAGLPWNAAELPVPEDFLAKVHWNLPHLFRPERSLESHFRQRRDDAEPAGEPEAKPEAKPEDKPETEPASEGGAKETDGGTNNSGKPADSSAPGGGGSKEGADDFPLPPVNVSFAGFPENFPYPETNVVQYPPIPTQPRGGNAPQVYPSKQVGEEPTGGTDYTSEPVSEPGSETATDPSTLDYFAQTEEGTPAASAPVQGPPSPNPIYPNQAPEDDDCGECTACQENRPEDWRFTTTVAPDPKCPSVAGPEKGSNVCPRGPSPRDGEAPGADAGAERLIAAAKPLTIGLVWLCGKVLFYI